VQASLAWVIRLLRLDFSAFDEIRGDPNTTTSAILVVYIASLLAGIGSWLWAVQSRDFEGLDRTDIFVKSLVIGSFAQTIFWFAWVYIVYQVIVRAYGSAVHFLDLIRTMGYAFAPVAISIFIAIGGFAVPFGLLAFGIALLLTSAAIQSAAEIARRPPLTSRDSLSSSHSWECARTSRRSPPSEASPRASSSSRSTSNPRPDSLANQV
jgi:hypothetical protein